MPLLLLGNDPINSAKSSVTLADSPNSGETQLPRDDSKDREKKLLRLFLQDGTNDLDNLHGHWPLANRQMASSLQFKGYDYRFEMGDGGHSGKHGGMLLPENLRWLWRDCHDVRAK